jgi:hypothetical protein
MGGGGGGGKKGGTKAPDFYDAARRTSMSSRPNVRGPMGSQTWTMGPDGRETSTTTSNYQDTFNALQDSTRQAASMDPTKARDEAVNQNLNYGMSRLNPMFDMQNNAFRSQMANSGLDAGTEAYNNSNQQLGTRQSDMFNTVYNTALNQGNETQRTQQAQSMLPFQQLGMLSGATGASNPNLGQPADYMGAASNQFSADRSNNQSQKGLGSVLGLAGGIGGSLFGGPIGGMLGGAAGNALGGAGKGKGGSAPGGNDGWAATIGTGEAGTDGWGY